jgi:chemotaxis protein methyltransferase CheR
MINADDYLFLSELLRTHSGLSLGSGKEYLLESRLPAVAATLSFDGLAALVQSLRSGAPAATIKLVCDAMTTNETLFFRDSKPFVALEKEFLPAAAERARAQGRAVRIWCAASSTGQEPYSIAMTVAQMEPALRGTRVEILATDFSTAAVTRARAGIYNQFEVQRGLPVQLLMKYFRPVGTDYELVPEIRQRVTFQEINLLHPFPAHWQFDIIFCRNVLLYFDVAVKRDVIDRMSRSLLRGGCLMLGGTESTLGITNSVVRVPNHVSGVFCRPGDLDVYTTRAAAA